MSNNRFEVKNIDMVLSEYDNLLAIATRERIIISTYANEVTAELEALREDFANLNQELEELKKKLSIE